METNRSYSDVSILSRTLSFEGLYYCLKAGNVCFLEFGSCLRVFLCLKRGTAGGGRQRSAELKLGGFSDKLTCWPVAVSCCLSFPV